MASRSSDMSERGEYSLKYHRVRLKVYLIFFIVSKFEEMETVCLGNHAAEEKKARKCR